jgi:heat shock protein HslJ
MWQWLAPHLFTPYFEGHCMKQLLLLALPLALAGCPGPQSPTPAASDAPAAAAPATSATPATTAPAALKPMDPNTQQAQFRSVGPIQAVNALPKQHWALQTAVDAHGQSIEALFARADKPLTLDFTASQLSISNTCNAMNASFKLSGPNLVTDKFAGTLKACEPKLMAMDQAIGKRLAGTLALRMAAGAAARLELTNSAGDVLVFAGNQTAETKYGGPGERVFLEISPDAKPCASDSKMLCAQMREIHYDDKGLKVGTPGPYAETNTQIEGFAVRPGVHSVVRVNRFPLKTAGKDGSKFAYVLDMVVEVEVVKPTGTTPPAAEATKPKP